MSTTKSPRILAFDATVEPGSCALWAGGQLCGDVHANQGETSSQALLPAATALLRQYELSLQTIDAIAFGAGPGAFTGLRVACGIAQGLAFGLGVPVLAVDSLAAVALSAVDNDPALAGEILVATDARMGEVYFARYRRSGATVERIGDARVAPPDQVDFGASTAIAGNALRAYPVIAARSAGLRQFPDLLPSAGAIARLAAIDFQRGKAIAAIDAAPVYVRDKVAQTVQERLAAGGRA